MQVRLFQGGFSAFSALCIEFYGFSVSFVTEPTIKICLLVLDLKTLT